MSIAKIFKKAILYFLAFTVATVIILMFLPVWVFDWLIGGRW